MKRGLLFSCFVLIIGCCFSIPNFSQGDLYCKEDVSISDQSRYGLYVNSKHNAVNQCRYAYYYDIITSMIKKMSFDLNCPGGELTFWAPSNYPSAGVQGGDGNFYIITAGTPNSLCKLDTSNGNVIILGQIMGMNESATGLAYNVINDSYYICGYSGSANYLYKLDINTLTTSSISTFGSSNCPIIAIAINSNGIGYGYDTAPNNNAYSFDPVTGGSTLLGPTGFSTNYVQDMDIDIESDIIYLAAFNNITNKSELRTMDPSTGMTTLLAPINAHISVFEFDNNYNMVPVELTEFIASVSGNSVKLDWSTSTEKNNHGFQIERKNISEIGNGNWKSIGFVNGQGTTTEPHSYTFTDQNLEAGKYQYRLKQMDLDGTFEYSQKSEVEIAFPENFSLEQNYPNPFNPGTKISWQSPVGSWQTLKLYDILGNEVATLVNEYRNSGHYEIEFQSSIGSLKLASGIYYYQLRAGDYVETKKMVLIK